ncbi:MAG: DUF2207 domain-containing protein [Aureispira sp.]|nr:DUF2207 domain-containing protein [Aureispira sp.]
MYKYQQSILSIGLLILAILLSSASYAPNLESSRDEGKDPKVTTQQEKRQVKLNKRLNRLSSKLDKATKDKQEKRLNKRIKKVKQQQYKKSKTGSIIAFILGIIALVLAVLTMFNPFIGIGAIVFSIVSFVLGLIFFKMTNREHFKSGAKGFAIAAIVLGATAFLLAVSLLVVSALFAGLGY